MQFTFGQALFEKFEGVALDLAVKKAAVKKLTKPAAHSVPEDGNPNMGTELGVEDVDSGNTKGVRRKKGNQTGGATAKPVPEMENVSDRKEGKGKRRSGKSKGEKHSGESLANVSKGSKSGAAGKGSGISSDEDDHFNIQYLAAKILEWFPDMESAGVGESFCISPLLYTF